MPAVPAPSPSPAPATLPRPIPASPAAPTPPGAAAGIVTSTDLPLRVYRKGKVRDVYEVTGDKGEALLLLVATDRISAFDVVLSPGIPLKGACLTQMSNFWFDHLSDMVPNHLVATDPAQFPAALRPHAGFLRGRAVLGERLQPIPVECVVRGYLAGSGWKDYQRTGAVCGIPLPPGLVESQKLPRTLFTPSTKAEKGHDENIPMSEVERLVGARTARFLEETSVALYEKAARFARSRGIIIADTKFEFGKRADGTIVLMDEILTPDSSRFWPADQYQPGRGQPSFDKQYLRDWLETQPWGKTPPGPMLPEPVVKETAKRYYEAFERITGRPFKV